MAGLIDKLQQIDQQKKQQDASRATQSTPRWESDQHRYEALSWAKKQYPEYDWGKYINGKSDTYTDPATGKKVARQDPGTAGVFYTAANQYNYNTSRFHSGKAPLAFKNASFDPSKNNDDYNEQVAAYVADKGVYPGDDKAFSQWRTVNVKYKGQYGSDDADQQRKAQGLPPMRVERTSKILADVNGYNAAVQRMFADGTYTPEAAQALLDNQYKELGKINAYVAQEAKKRAESDTVSLYDPKDPLDGYADVDTLKQHGYDPNAGFVFRADTTGYKPVGGGVSGLQGNEPQAAATTQPAQQIPQGGTNTMFERGADGKLHPVLPAANNTQPPRGGLMSALDKILPKSIAPQSVVPIPKGLEQAADTASILSRALPQNLVTNYALGTLPTAIKSAFLNIMAAGASTVNGKPVEFTPDMTMADYTAKVARERNAPDLLAEANKISPWLGIPVGIVAEIASDPTTFLGVGEAQAIARGGKTAAMGTDAYASALRNGALEPRLPKKAAALKQQNTRAELNAMEAEQTAKPTNPIVPSELAAVGQKAETPAQIAIQKFQRGEALTPAEQDLFKPGNFRNRGDFWEATGIKLPMEEAGTKRALYENTPVNARTATADAGGINTPTAAPARATQPAYAPDAPANKTMAAAVDDAETLIVDPKLEARTAKAKEFAAQTGGTLESAASKVSYDARAPKPAFSMWDRLRSAMVDKYANIERAEKTILGKLPGADNSAYKQARLYAGVPERANLAIQKELNPIIKSVEKTGKNYKDLGLYSLAVHARDVNGAGMISGFTNAEIDDVIRKLGTPEMEAARKALVDYSNRRLDTLAESGRISREAVDAMRAKWKNYIPLSRVMDESETGFIKGLSESFASVAQPIKGLQGSERRVIDPIESLMRNTYLIENAAGRSEVAKRLGALADADGEHRFFRALTDKEAEGKAHVVKVYRNGKEVKYETTKEIFDEVAGMNKEQSNTFVKILSAPASVLRAGATLTPEFAIRNPIRDVMNAWFVSDVGFNPIVDFPRGLASAIKKDSLYQEFIKAKGGFGNVMSMDRQVYRNAIEGAISQPVTKKFVTILNPKTWLEGLRAVSDATETATKVGVYGAARRKGLTAAEAAYQARDTMDFARVGSSVQPANRVVAFLNANIQGKSKLIRAIQERPVKTLSKIAVGMTMPSIGAFFWNQSVANDEQKRIMDDAPNWLRDSFWLVAVPGTDQVARIPKPFELAIFANTTERFMDYAVKKDPHAFDGFAADMLKQQAVPIMPTGILPILEGMSNYSYFRRGPIVPQREENLPTSEQYDSGTSEVAKGAASLVRAVTGGERSTDRFGSPRIMDYALRSSTAGLGNYALDAVDTLLESVGLVPDKNKTARNTSQLPLARAFLVNEGGAGRSMEFTYTERDAMTKARNSFRLKNPGVQYPDEAKYRYITAAADAVSELSAQIRDVNNSETMSPEVKREEINALNKQRNAITQAAQKQYDGAPDMTANGYAAVMPFVLTGKNKKTGVEKTTVLTPEQHDKYQREFQERVEHELSRIKTKLALSTAEERQKSVDNAVEKVRSAMREEILWDR